MNTSNCSTCLYKYKVQAGAHCYMFKHEPATKCRQWKPNLLPFPTPIRRIDLERSK